MKIKEASQADVREIYLNMLKREIRNTYTIDDEFKLMNLGLLDKTNEEFVAYRENIALLTIGDATLGGEVGRVLLTGKTVASNVISFVGDFPAGTGTGTIVEGGIFNASSGGVMLNRATFSAVSKTASDALKITWDVTFG